MGLNHLLQVDYRALVLAFLVLCVNSIILVDITISLQLSKNVLVVNLGGNPTSPFDQG
ncbi:hypothetical protein AG1IA_04852 [Rhizoctonia solani AG-1 IA]|uniref:Uncharacterized protein n=1 Tax=Thanatephorus cucumeris (strain AG1-IA) TaxID=983506 RepID=L8WT07_THACA|nr:hypothetical protein AG1IA_04852 [Rhizoctonia solani AG-1 IA]